MKKEYVTGHKALYVGATGMATEISGIIRSHMDEVPDNNDGWIPVSEKLPEVGKMVKITVHSSEWIGDYLFRLGPRREKTYHPEERNVYDGYIDRVGMWKFYDPKVRLMLATKNLEQIRELCTMSRQRGCRKNR